MKLYHYALTALGLATASLFCFQAAQASGTYKVTVLNQSSYPITVDPDSSSNKCISSYSVTSPANGSFPQTIQSEAMMTFEYTDKNTWNGSCSGVAKKLYLNMQSNTSTQVSAQVYIYHGNEGSTTNGDWYTQISTQNATKATTTVAGLDLKSATCGPNNANCLDTKYYSNGNFDMMLSVGAFVNKVKAVAIGLGSITLTTSYGQPVSDSSDSGSSVYSFKLNDAISNYYLFHFSSTTQSCGFINDALSCDPGITYYYDSSKNYYVFMCQQSKTGQPQCPWLTKGSTGVSRSNNLNSMNIYSS
ncbi:hypothetical protein L3V82_05575 [Thiotrichales bacterium 19S3-7]|nr:hypothetical protein [Thiotrichales bacterium 19S3-7]MCF6801563.1 hypothetical protein [Thiotrichales bacterium 19S3-11]